MGGRCGKVGGVGVAGSFLLGIGAGALLLAIGDAVRTGDARRLRRTALRNRDSEQIRERVHALLRARSGPHAAPVPDEELLEHVRAQLARPYLSHPGLLDAQVRNGHVLLSGSVRASEVNDLVVRLAQVDGVRSIRSRVRVIRPGAQPRAGGKAGLPAR